MCIIIHLKICNFGENYYVIQKCIINIPGYDQTSNSIIKNLPKMTFIYFTYIFKLIFAYNPRDWTDFVTNTQTK